MTREDDLSDFLSGYIECALWSSTVYAPGDDCEELGQFDDLYGRDDISEATAVEMWNECNDFLTANADDLAAYVATSHGLLWGRYSSAGHDFWLTRNGHGAGFWDRGLGDLGDRLSKAAKVYGSVDLYVGDDGQVHA